TRERMAALGSNRWLRDRAAERRYVLRSRVDLGHPNAQLGVTYLVDPGAQAQGQDVGGGHRRNEIARELPERRETQGDSGGAPQPGLGQECPFGLGELRGSRRVPRDRDAVLHQAVVCGLDGGSRQPPGARWLVAGVGLARGGHEARFSRPERAVTGARPLPDPAWGPAPQVDRAGFGPAWRSRQL